MTFSVEEPPSNRIVNVQLASLGKITVRGIRQALYTIGATAKTEINRAVLEKPRSGNTYKYKNRRHVASRRGESFANRSGAARRTLGFNVRGADEVEFGFRQNGETIYTKILEESEGARYRPTVGNASKQIQGRAQNVMEQELKKAHEQGYK